MTNINWYAIILQWGLPFAIAMLTFLIFILKTKKLNELASFDRAWHLGVRVAIIIGSLYAVWVFVEHTGYPRAVMEWANHEILLIKSQDVVQRVLAYIAVYFVKFIAFLAKWLPFYERAYVIIFTIGSVIALQGLYWQIRFIYTLNIFAKVLALSPILGIKYFLGYQTPMWDSLTASRFKAKIKENANDSLESALRGYTDTGEKFQNGQGGTVATQRLKQMALAIRRSHVKIVTDGKKRVATVTVHISREGETDRAMLSSMLNGLGRRLSANNIRFADNPFQDDKSGWFVFSSDIEYNAGDNLGNWRAIFANPFDEKNDIRIGGRSPISVFVDVVRDVLRYIARLSPVAIFYHVRDSANKRYKIDDSIYNANYQAHQNLDLSLIPVPKNIDVLRKKAYEKAQGRLQEVTRTLNTYDLNAEFVELLVGGNTATYVFTLPKNTKRNLNLEPIQQELANALGMNDIPMLHIGAGRLTVTLVNGVVIPVSFSDMIKKRRKGMSVLISGMLGIDAMGENIYLELGDKNPHGMGFGKTGTGKTVSIETFLYSLMSSVDPDDVRIMYVDGKGNSFEHMKYDGDTPNPYTWAPPADASGDIEYARALISYAENETRRRIDLFKQKAVSKLKAYNDLDDVERLPEILFVVDEFSAITQQDKNLKASELAEKGTVDKFEYIAKMSRSTGIRLLMANQSARKELVPGKITANITGRFSLGVTEPIESDIAMPETGLALHRISQAGEFYSTFEYGSVNPQHGNSPYLNDDVKKALNACLIKKFGHLKYGITREEVMGDANVEDVPKPDPMLTTKSQLSELIDAIDKFPQWAVQNENSPIFKKNENIAKLTPARAKHALHDIETKIDGIKATLNAQTHNSTGDNISTITTGSDQKPI